MQIFPLSNLQVPNKGKVFLCLAVFYASVKIGQEAVSFCKFPKACSPQNHLTEFSSLTCFSMHFVKLPGVIQVFNEIVRSYFHLLIAIRFYSIRITVYMSQLLSLEQTFPPGNVFHHFYQTRCGKQIVLLPFLKCLAPI